MGKWRDPSLSCSTLWPHGLLAAGSRTAPQDQNPAAIARAVTAFEAKLAIAEQQLSRQTFLALDRFTLADIQFGHVLCRAIKLRRLTRPFPAVDAYYQRLTERPAYRTHVMISYEDLRVL